MSSKSCCNRVNNRHAYDCKSTPQCPECGVRLDTYPMHHAHNCQYIPKCKCGARLDIQPICHTSICSKVPVDSQHDQKGLNLRVSRYCKCCDAEAKAGHYLDHQGWCS